VRPPAKRTRCLPFRAQFVFAKEISQRLQSVRELLDRRAVLDEARRVNSRCPDVNIRATNPRRVNPACSPVHGVLLNSPAISSPGG